MHNWLKLGAPACIVCHQNVEEHEDTFHICAGKGGNSTYSGFTVHFNCIRNKGLEEAKQSFMASRAAMTFNMLVEGD